MTVNTLVAGSNNLPVLYEDNKLIQLWQDYDFNARFLSDVNNDALPINPDSNGLISAEKALCPVDNDKDTARLEEENTDCLLDDFFDLAVIGSYSIEHRFQAMVMATETALKDSINQDQAFWSSMLEQDNSIDNGILFDRLLLDIDDRVAAQVDAVLHHPQWQSIESSWRSVDYLLQQAGGDRNVITELLDVSLDEWEDHLAETRSEHSHLQRIIYQNSYDMPGAFPYTAIVSGYSFKHHQGHLQLLEKMASVAMSAHCPLLANVDHDFFRKQTMADVATIQDVGSYLSQADYIAWQAFREKECSRYVGLSLPKFLLRSLYGQNIPVRGFPYNEYVDPLQPEQHLWAPASFALARNMIRSFSCHGWPVHIRGPRSGGKVPALPLISYGHNEFQIPTEMLIPEARELQLAEAGFIPLSYYAGTEFACFFSANAAHKPAIYDSNEATSNSRINARLPYIFLTSRVAHYIKVLQREVIGMQCAADQLQSQLQRWLQGMVTQMNQPDADLMARYPLREAKVEVIEREDNPGFFHVELSLIPHFQVEGMDVKLFLVSRLPSGKNQ